MKFLGFEFNRKKGKPVKFPIGHAARNGTPEEAVAEFLSCGTHADGDRDRMRCILAAQEAFDAGQPENLQAIFAADMPPMHGEEIRKDGNDMPCLVRGLPRHMGDYLLIFASQQPAHMIAKAVEKAAPAKRQELLDDALTYLAREPKSVPKEHRTGTADKILAIGGDRAALINVRGYDVIKPVVWGFSYLAPYMSIVDVQEALAGMDDGHYFYMLNTTLSHVAGDKCPWLSHGEKLVFMSMLKDLGADVNCGDGLPLIKAAGVGDKDAIALLKKEGAIVELAMLTAKRRFEAKGGFFLPFADGSLSLYSEGKEAKWQKIIETLAPFKTPLPKRNANNLNI